MPAQIRLFVSAGPEEEPAREQLGRALTELPANVGWVIKRTPDVDSVAECHLYLLVLGSDISAPVGHELYWARRTEKPVLAYASDRAHTPACQVFLQENRDLEWRTYHDLPGLRRQALRDLAHFTLRHAERYGLALTEISALNGFIERLDQAQPKTAPAQASGAAGGGVILAPGKDEPAGTRVIGES